MRIHADPDPDPQPCQKKTDHNLPVKTTAPHRDATAKMQKHPAGFATAEAHPEG